MLPDRPVNLAHLSVCISWLTISITTAPSGNAQTPADEYVATLHNAFSEIRQSEYGNVHMVLENSTKGSNGFSEKKSISYWAKDGNKFRIDQVIQNKDEPPTHLRFIVRPEGFVVLKKSEGGFAMVDYGENEEGLDRVEVEDFFCASTRCFRFINAEAPFGFQPEVALTNPLSKTWAKNFTPLEATRNGDELVLKSRFEHSLDGPVSSSVIEVKYDMAHHVHTSYKQLSRNENCEYEKLNVTKQYDFSKYRHIPKITTVEDVRKAGAWQTSEWTVTHVDWTPIPDGIFSLDAQGAGPRGNVWIRRLVMFVVGVSLVVGFFAYRRMKNHG